jgi:hypothetical protein
VQQGLELVVVGALGQRFDEHPPVFPVDIALGVDERRVHLREAPDFEVIRPCLDAANQY